MIRLTYSIDEVDKIISNVKNELIQRIDVLEQKNRVLEEKVETLSETNNNLNKMILNLEKRIASCVTYSGLWM